MRGRSLSLLLVIPAFATQAYAADQSAAAPEPSFGRGVFVFSEGHSIVLDTQERLEDSVPLFLNRLEDCSNEQYYCLAGYTVRVALPKTCRELRAGDTWQVDTRQYGPVPMTVLRGEEVVPPKTASPHYSPYRIVLLGDPARPNIVYGYEPSHGLTKLYVAGQYKDVVGLAVTGGNAALDNAATNEKVIRSYYLASFDDLGVCTPAGR